MSQAYGKSFARVYDEMWGDFGRNVAYRVMDFYRHKENDGMNKNVLDVCCGTGHLALEFLKNKYHVVGIDLSPHMLLYAREKTKEYLDKGLAQFIEADASDFTIENHFGLAVSTYDAMNHLKGKQMLKRCFYSVFRSVVQGGYFIFDLNTRLGLEGWNGIHINDSKRLFLLINGIFNREREEAITRVSGFIQEEGDCYSRFEEVVYNYAYPLELIESLLRETGWKEIYFAIIDNLNKSVREPEQEKRIFVVAKK